MRGFGEKIGKINPAQKKKQIASGVEFAVQVVTTKVMALTKRHTRDVGQCTSSSQSSNRRHPLTQSPAQPITRQTAHWRALTKRIIPANERLCLKQL